MSLGAVGACVSLAMAVVVVATSPRNPWLSLVFAEAFVFFLGVLTSPFPAVGLSLNYASAFIGVPSLYLFAREISGDPCERPLRHFAPAFVNVPLGVFMAVTTAANGMRGGVASALYYLALNAGMTAQWAAYGRSTIRVSRAKGGNGQWLGRIVASLLAGYGVFVALGWVSYALALGSESFARVAAIRAAVTQILVFVPSLVVAVFLVWTVGLCVLWGGDFASAERREERKYGGKALDGSRAADIVERARRLIADERNLSSESVLPRAIAARLDVPYYLLSRAVNECALMSVSDLVNAERVARAKRFLEGDGDLTILDIALESGFLAKSTFNDVFLRAVGKSPRDYREAARADRARRGERA